MLVSLAMSSCKCCSAFEKTCKVVLKHPKGVVVLIEECCEEMQAMDLRMKKILAKGPVGLKKGGDLRNGPTRVPSV